MTTPIPSPNLAQQPPHSPRDRLAGFVIAKRAVDKCRANLTGTLGEYQYDCPLDNMLFSFKGVTAKQFTAAVQAATDYDQVGAWLQANGAAKTPTEIKKWSDEMEAESPMKDPARRSRFIDHCSRLCLNPETNSTFDWLEADDRACFPRKAVKV